mgnify:CR=1 FL=1
MSPAIENGEVVLVDRLIVDMKTPSRGTVVDISDQTETVKFIFQSEIVGLPGETVRSRTEPFILMGKSRRNIFMYQR